MLMKMSTKWMVDVITLSNNARHHLCHKKSEQGLICNQSFYSYPMQILEIYVVVFQRMDRK